MKSIKALLLLTTAFGIFTLYSCKKDDNATVSVSFSAKINGSATDFSKDVSAIKGEANGAAFTAIQGNAADGSSISITIYGTPVAGKTYLSTASNIEDRPLILYSTADDENYLNDDDSTSNLVSVTVTSVSGNIVQGTFKGDVETMAVFNTTTKIKSVTEGKFSANLSNK